VQDDVINRPEPDRIRTRAEFGEELTKLREQAGLTVRDLALRAGVPSATVGGYLRARHLPSAGQLAAFRSLLTACGVVDETVIERWVAALGRARSSSDGRIAHAVSPYPGLAPFGVDDAAIFFGRDQAITMVVQAVREAAAGGADPMVALVGASGSGKSSLLCAGVIPTLAADGIGGAPATTRVITPTDAPCDALDQALRDAPRVLVVDQFEELFTLCGEPAERQRFLEALASLDPADTVVILALRADFYAAAAQEPRLVGALQEAQILLGPMTRDELRAAIVGPAHHVGASVDDALVELLLSAVAPEAADESGYVPGALPILSHALLATWNHADHTELTVADYLAVGGLNDAIAQTAEAVYAELSQAGRAVARRLFQRLVVVDSAVIARRRLARSELDSITNPGSADARLMTEVLDRFVAARLLTVDADSVQISHEALLMAWPRLRKGLDEDRAWLRLQGQVADAANAWHTSERDPGLLLRAAKLDAAIEYASDPVRYAALSHIERDLLDASVAERDRERDAERRHGRRLRRLLIAVASLAVVTCLLAAFAFYSQSVAADQRNSATRARDVALSQQVALQVERLRATHPSLAAQLALAAYRISPTPQAVATLLDTSAMPTATRLLGPSGPMQSVAASADGKLIAATTADGDVRLWRLPQADGPETPVRLTVQRPSKQPLTLFAVTMNPAGSLLATGGAGRTVQLWDISDPAQPHRLTTLTGPTNTVYALAFSPDGTILAAGSADGLVHRWRLTSSGAERALAPLSGADGYVQSVAFSPDGRQISAGTSLGDVDTWDAVRSAEPATVEHTVADQAIFSVAYSPDGRVLAAGGQGGDIRRWDVTGAGAPRSLSPLTGYSSWVNSIAFSSDGSMIAGGSSDDSVRIWDTGAGSLLRILTAPSPVTSIEFLRAGTALVAATNNGTALIWPVADPVLEAGGKVFAVQYDRRADRLTVGVGSKPAQLWDTTVWPPRELTSTLSSPSSSLVLDGTAALSPDGRLLAAGTSQGPVVLWNVSDPRAPQLLRTLSGPTLTDELVAFSPDGRVLAASSDDTTVHLWGVSDPAAPTALPTLQGNSGYLYNFAFSQDGSLLAVPGVDDQLELWNLHGRQHPIRAAVLRGFANYVYAAAFTPDGHVLAAASADRTVRLYDVRDPRSPQLITTLAGPTDYLLSDAISPDGRLLAAGSGDGSVWLWNIADATKPSLVAQLPIAGGAIYALTFAPVGHTLTVGSGDGTVHLIDTDTRRVAQQICASSGAPITRAEWQQYVPGAKYDPPCR
jgi:WD40 repeat protein/transcriptional regulator with XRE-family HTH domain